MLETDLFLERRQAEHLHLQSSDFIRGKLIHRACGRLLPICRDVIRRKYADYFPTDVLAADRGLYLPQIFAISLSLILIPSAFNSLWTIEQPHSRWRVSGL